MKLHYKFLFLIFFLSAVALPDSAHAQHNVPNLDFELWHAVQNTPNALDPDGYRSNNEATAVNNRIGIRRSTDSYSGQYALELSPLVSPNSNTSLTSEGFLGFPPLNLNTYELDFMQSGLTGMFPNPTPLDTIKGYYKFIPQAPTDTAFVRMKLIWRHFTNSLLVDGYVFFAPSSSYAPFAIPVYQTFFGNPLYGYEDLSVGFFYKSNNTSLNPTGRLLIDSLSFSPGAVTSIGAQASLENEKISLWPSPARELLHYTIPVGARGEISLLNTQGQVVWHGRALVKGTIPMHGIPRGLYFVKVLDELNGKVYLKKVLKE